jgi:hypothetical protein
MPRFEIRNFRSQRGHEGPGFYCILWVDGVRAAEAIDHGDGGPVWWTWFDAEARRKFDEYVAAQPEEPYGHGIGGTLKPDADWVIARLVAEHEVRRKIARGIKTKCLFRLKSDEGKDVAFRTLNMPYGPDAVAYLRKKFGDDLKEILNETFVP